MSLLFSHHIPQYYREPNISIFENNCIKHNLRKMLVLDIRHLLHFWKLTTRFADRLPNMKLTYVCVCSGREKGGEERGIWRGIWWRHGIRPVRLNLFKIWNKLVKKEKAKYSVFSLGILLNENVLFPSGHSHWSSWVLHSPWWWLFRYIYTSHWMRVSSVLGNFVKSPGCSVWALTRITCGSVLEAKGPYLSNQINVIKKD